MNVYDFDGTIYEGDSSLDFYIFCLKRQPSIIRALPIQLFYVLLYGMGRCDKTYLKQKFFSFLRFVISVPEVVEQFWRFHESKVATWYMDQRRSDDVVISASPDFLLRPICKKLGIGGLVASEVHEKSGLFASVNCKGAEKVKRFRMLYGDSEVNEFYSDSRSDLPMARLAKTAYLVKNGKLSVWNLNDM